MKHYSKSQIREILDMHYNKGMKIKEIAEKIGRTPKAVGNACSRYKDMVPGLKTTTPIQTSKKNQEKIDELLKRSNEVNITAEEMQKTADEAIADFYGKQQKPKVTMTPREMIKHLYTLGYRIKDNQLIVLVEQKVNLKDIING